MEQFASKVTLIVVLLVVATVGGVAGIWLFKNTKPN
jgi:flagellar basal body-associated protein FliL